MAVEVFSGDGRNYLLAFQKGVRNKVYQRYMWKKAVVARISLTLVICSQD